MSVYITLPQMRISMIIISKWLQTQLQVSSLKAHEAALEAIKYLQRDALITVADVQSAI